MRTDGARPGTHARMLRQLRKRLQAGGIDARAETSLVFYSVSFDNSPPLLRQRAAVVSLSFVSIEIRTRKMHHFQVFATDSHWT